MDRSQSAHLSFEDPAVFARHASSIHELREQGWAFFQSTVKSRSHLLLDNSAKTWGLCYSTSDRTLDTRVEDNGRLDACPVEQNPFATVSLVKDTSGDVEQSDACTEISCDSLEVEVYINGAHLIPGEPRKLQSNDVVRFNGAEYIYRHLIGAQDTPYGVEAERYDVREPIAVGESAPSRWIAKHLKTRQAVVVKRITVPTRRLDEVASNIRICDELRHRNIVSLFDCYMHPEDLQRPERRISIVTSFTPHGNLHDFITVGNGKLGETLSRPVMAQLMDGLMYMHDQGILHCDMKPEHVLVYGLGSAGPIVKISGLGLATRSGKNDGRELSPSLRRAMMKSAAWAPPESLNYEHTELSDAFSLGAIMFFIHWGKPLYDIEGGMFFEEIMQRRRTNFTKLRRQMMSSNACDLIESLTKVSMSERIGLREARRHAWFNGCQVPPPFSAQYQYDDPLVQEFIARGGRPAVSNHDPVNKNGLLDFSDCFSADSDSLFDAGLISESEFEARRGLEWDVLDSLVNSTFLESEGYFGALASEISPEPSSSLATICVIPITGAQACEPVITAGAPSFVEPERYDYEETDVKGWDPVSETFVSLADKPNRRGPRV
ncbi:kinase-like protein [Punctularia strigosozonata HHB-11173 SS5]|uniref:Kinase-like protein n=1 Tax=Punctularia strigosozonata (strain HHB-11173) TaxID=741275 RepID=R7S412_PUNST|nr:kinase-like protein [Punctularia strigosozonata HHB-11173 SS5]EIN04537.1 kinase-like protein [Punctularia strigosozonata HHB-11173 SS5]